MRDPGIKLHDTHWVFEGKRRAAVVFVRWREEFANLHTKTGIHRGDERWCYSSYQELYSLTNY